MNTIKEKVKKVSDLNVKGFTETQISQIMNISEVEVYRILSGSNSPILRGPSLKSQKDNKNKRRYP
tara:strand:- start:357 stop:554 length:198 start_codon:yes stop_codon:yes gene_type:complete